MLGLNLATMSGQGKEGPGWQVALAGGLAAGKLGRGPRRSHRADSIALPLLIRRCEKRECHGSLTHEVLGPLLSIMEYDDSPSGSRVGKRCERLVTVVAASR